jgi:biopolymer transport protein ExbD
VTHRSDLAVGGRLSVDGAAIANAMLPGGLAALRADPNAERQIAADPQARDERFGKALAVIKRSGITRSGFVGNERFKDFRSRDL